MSHLPTQPELLRSAEIVTKRSDGRRLRLTSSRFAVALSAIRLLHDGDRQRLHRCGNNRCVLMFYDIT
jgi:predicted RNA-binding Zn ribbon-like protein